MILYISIGLFISGIFVLFYSLITGAVHKSVVRIVGANVLSGAESRTRAATESKPRSSARAAAGSDDEIPYIDDILREDDFSGFSALFDKEEAVASVLSSSVVKTPEESFPDAETEVMPLREKPAAADSAEAVLYLDSSSLISYESSSGLIDSSLDDYKNIRRVGKGRISVEKEGINFRLDNRFYRFDFRRIESIKTGENYLSVFLNKSDSVKLFVFESDSGFIKSAADEFSSFVRRSG